MHCVYKSLDLLLHNMKLFHTLCVSNGLWMHVVICILIPDICWAFGGYLDGTPDITLARKGVLSFLPAGEFVIADKGYYGEPDKIITPHNYNYSDTFNYQHKLMMGRHEGINKRVKDFK